MSLVEAARLQDWHQSHGSTLTAALPGLQQSPSPVGAAEHSTPGCTARLRKLLTAR